MLSADTGLSGCQWPVVSGLGGPESASFAKEDNHART